MYNITLIIKKLKVYKMLNYNSTISYLSKILSESEIIDNYGSAISSIILSILCLNEAPYLSPTRIYYPLIYIYFPSMISIL